MPPRSSLAHRLRRMNSAVAAVANRELGRHVQDVGAQIATSMQATRWKSASKSADERLRRSIEAVRGIAEIGDAAACLSTQLFSGRHSRVVDIRVAGLHVRDVQNEIALTCADQRFPRRGFIYVAWRARPEAYHYVGRASSAARLNQHSHGMLALAIRDSVTLSLLFPHHSRARNIVDVEASVMRVISAFTGKMPTWNDRPEPIPRLDPSKCLNGVSWQLTRLGKSLRTIE